MEVAALPRTRHLQILTTSSSFVSHAVAVTDREVTEPRPNEGVWGNERLTAVTGAVLFVLLAVEGITILFLRPLLIVHMFVGMALIAPAALKIGSTGYRFARYYTGSPAYRRKGPPHLVHRALGPVVVVSTVVVLATGVGLAVAGPPGGVLLGVHKASFVVWLVVMTVHVLGRGWRVPRLVASDWRVGRSATPARPRGAPLRRIVVVAAIGAGLALGAVTLPLAHPWVHQAATSPGDD